MGCFPDYLEFSRDHNINALAVPERLWRVMVNSGELWTMISSFWRQVARSKRSIILASNPGLISSSSLFAMELEFLGKLGYLPDPTGARLDFGHGIVAKAVGHTPSAGPLSLIQSFVRKLFPQSTFRAGMQRKLMPKGSDPAFEEKVRQGLSFLLRDFSACVVSNQHFPGAFGNVVLILAIAPLLLRVVRDRDELRIDVAPAREPTQWRLLTVAVAAAEGNTQNPVLASCIRVHQAAALLEARFESLRAAFLPESYATIEKAMWDIETTKLKDWVAKFNG
jgi:hypothetical protein